MFWNNTKVGSFQIQVNFNLQTNYYLISVCTLYKYIAIICRSNSKIYHCNITTPTYVGMRIPHNNLICVNSDISYGIFQCCSTFYECFSAIFYIFASPPPPKRSILLGKKLERREKLRLLKSEHETWDANSSLNSWANSFCHNTQHHHFIIHVSNWSIQYHINSPLYTDARNATQEH